MESKMSVINTANDIINRLHKKHEKKEKHPAEKAMLTIEEICSQLEKRENFNGNYEELVRYVRMFFGEMSNQLFTGFTVNTDYFSIHPVVDKAGLPLRTRALMRRSARSVVINADEKANRGHIEFFTDTATGTVNERITPAGIFIAEGKLIKIDGDKPDCGVWFASMVDASLRFKVIKTLNENLSGRVSGYIPIIPAGKYRIEIITQYTGSGVLLKKPRTLKGRFTLRNYKILSIKDEEESEETV